MSCCQGLRPSGKYLMWNVLEPCLNDKYMCVLVTLDSLAYPLMTASVVTPNMRMSFNAVLIKSLCIPLCSDPGQVWDGWETRHSTTGEQLPEGPRHQRGRHIWWSQAGQTLEQGLYVCKEGEILKYMPWFYAPFFCRVIVELLWLSVAAGG